MNQRQENNKYINQKEKNENKYYNPIVCSYNINFLYK